VRRHRIQVDNADIAYTQIEAEALRAVLPGIDLRAAVCAELSYVGGRRITAIRTLQTASYRTEDRILVLDGESMSQQFGLVTFPAKTDKARKKGEVYVWGHAKALLEELLATPACRASGLLFPKLALESSSVPSDPITEKVLRSWLRRAEDQAGVRSVRGRSYHGLNRAFATVAADPLAASGQSGKTLATLERYRQALPDEKAALAIQIDSLRRGA
jgi:integrase